MPKRCETQRPGSTRARSRQAGVNLMVEDRLIRWLAEATGQSWSDIVQRLARDLNDLLPTD